MKPLALVAALTTIACGGGNTGTSSTPQMANLPDPTGPEIPNGFTEQVLSAVRGIPFYVTVKGLFLNAAEGVEAETIVAKWASAQGVKILPPSQTNLLFRRALAGKHVTTGATCGAPLFEFQAVERWKSELGAGGKLEARISCDPTCTIQIAISIGTNGEGGTEFFAAPFDPSKPWRDELAARLPTIVDNGGHNKHGHLNNPVAVQGIARDPTKLDAILDDSAKVGTLTANESAATLACLSSDRTAIVFVEYDAAGKLARCEPAPQYLAGAADCVCAALANHTSTANTRERFDLARPAGAAAAKSKSGHDVRAIASAARIRDDMSGLYKPMTTDPALEHWEPPDRDLLAPCFADSPTDTPIDGRATIDFDRAGKAIKATIVAMKGTFTPQQHTCLQEQFMATRAPCPSTQPAQAVAEINVTFEKN